VLCTHSGLSGPAILDVSRHLLAARAVDRGAGLVVNWVPGMTADELDEHLRTMGAGTPLRLLQGHGRLPERLARALCGATGVDPATPGHRLSGEGRLALGFNFQWAWASGHVAGLGAAAA
jgi:predicted flavoprotein YhiN